MSVDVRPRILIVDDEAEITAILADLLEVKYDCTTAGSAEEALESFVDSGLRTRSQRYHHAGYERP